jgi:hypothetical protein
MCLFFFFWEAPNAPAYSGPEIIALMTPLPSSLFPARVALKAVIASLKAKLEGNISYTYMKLCERLHRCVTRGLRSTFPLAAKAMAKG